MALSITERFWDSNNQSTGFHSDLPLSYRDFIFCSDFQIVQLFIVTFDLTMRKKLNELTPRTYGNLNGTISPPHENHLQ